MIGKERLRVKSREPDSIGKRKEKGKGGKREKWREHEGRGKLR